VGTGGVVGRGVLVGVAVGVGVAVAVLVGVLDGVDVGVSVGVGVGSSALHTKPEPKQPVNAIAAITIARSEAVLPTASMT
jgi:hypothetical protein